MNLTRLLIVAVPILLVLAYVVTARKAGEDWEHIILSDIPAGVGILIFAAFVVIPVVLFPFALIYLVGQWVLGG